MGMKVPAFGGRFTTALPIDSREVKSVYVSALQMLTTN